MKPNKITFDREHHSRNIGLLTEEDHKILASKTLLVAGCGVGSQVSLSATRIGFEKFILVDGDKVELSNNNRQGYTWRDVGKFKVDALARRIKAINPHAKIKKFPIFVDTKNAEGLVEKADIVLDIIDPDAMKAVIAIHRATKRQNKFVIQPNDLGWGAMVQIFSPEGLSFESMVGLNPHAELDKIDEEKSFETFVQFFMKIMPDYVQKLIMEFAEGKLPNYPQPVSASYILSAMTVIAAKRIALGLPVKVAPEYISFDPNLILIPDEKK